MVALLFCADSIVAGGKGKNSFGFVHISFKGPLDPDPALLGTIIAHPLASTCNATLQLFAKLEVSNDPNICIGGPKILKFGPWT